MRTLFTINGKEESDVEDINRCFAARHTDGFWLDIENPDEPTTTSCSRNVFKFHPLTIEDIRNRTSDPRSTSIPSTTSP